jgi:activating signal cointegrator 1
MKALTLTQPWATLVAIGEKEIGTRSWATNYRGPLAIHAAKGLGPVGGAMGLVMLCAKSPFSNVLIENGITLPGLPRGAIVAVCELIGCEPAAHYAYYHGISDQERAFGDYADGRYAWLLADIRRLLEPIPCRGARRLWEPDTLTAMAIRRQLIAGVGV